MCGIKSLLVFPNFAGLPAVHCLRIYERPIDCGLRDRAKDSVDYSPRSVCFVFFYNFEATIESR